MNTGPEQGKFFPKFIIQVEAGIQLCFTMKKPCSAAAVFKATFSKEGNVVHLHSPIWQPQAVAGMYLPRGRQLWRPLHVQFKIDGDRIWCMCLKFGSFHLFFSCSCNPDHKIKAHSCHMMRLSLKTRMKRNEEKPHKTKVTGVPREGRMIIFRHNICCDEKQECPSKQTTLRLSFILECQVPVLLSVLESRLTPF